MESADILIKDANELVTLKGVNQPRTKKQMINLSIIRDGSIAIRNGKIIDVGKNLKYNSETVIDSKGKTVLPGFVDPHTHVVFSGSREFELEMKLQGKSYMDILGAGGGIFYTVNKTREATENSLIEQSKKRLNNMLEHGTTTCEAKTGYGLEAKTELKLLNIQKKLDKIHDVDIVSTFLGAHAVPKNLNSDDYVEQIINEMLPNIRDLATFCDVFCEKGVFTVKQSKRILEEAKKYNLIPKLHADEIVDTGGALLAAQVEAISADHLLMSNDIGLKKMVEKNVIGVLLPGTTFSLMQQNYARAREMIDMNLPIALATDLNPNCWIENMQFIIQLACLNMRMTPSEAITAATFNAACAIGKNKDIGSLEIGKKADIIILDCPSYKIIPYHIGKNLVKTVIKNGKIIKK